MYVLMTEEGGREVALVAYDDLPAATEAVREARTARPGQLFWLAPGRG